MNILLISLTLIAVLYIVVSAFKYAFTLVFTSSLVIAGSTLANHYAGQSAMLLVLIIAPVLYIAIPELDGILKSVVHTLSGIQIFSGLITNAISFMIRVFIYITSLFAKAPKLFPLVRNGSRLLKVVNDKALTEVEDQPLKGEWISGKTPQLTFKQILIGDLKALPRPWL